MRLSSRESVREGQVVYELCWTCVFFITFFLFLTTFNYRPGEVLLFVYTDLWETAWNRAAVGITPCLACAVTCS